MIGKREFPCRTEKSCENLKNEQEGRGELKQQKIQPRAKQVLHEKSQQKSAR